MTTRRVGARRAVLGVLAVAATIAAAGGCGSSPAAGRPKSAPASTGFASPSPCPSPTARSHGFPAGPSSQLPRPDFATSPQSLPVQLQGVDLLRFTTAMSLRDAVLFLLQRYPAAGYVLGRGDAEVNEADAPFVRGPVHGTTRLSRIGPCTTTWLVATVSQPGAALGNLPQLAPHTASSTPLPFGH